MLSNTPNEVANATKGLDGAVNDLRGFVAENREGLGVTFDHLNAITTALNDSRGDIKQVLHIAPTVFQNFMNIYQPAQSAVTGILAPVNFANTVQFICSAIQAASRENWEQSSKLCVQYLAPIIKNRQYNFPPLGINPFAGASARPNEITYSEDRLNPHLPPQTPPDVPAAPSDPPNHWPAEAATGCGSCRRRRRPPTPARDCQGLMVSTEPEARREARAGCGAHRRVRVRDPGMWVARPQFAEPAGNRRRAATVRTRSRRRCPTWLSFSRTPGCGSPTSTSATSPRSRYRTGMRW